MMHCYQGFMKRFRKQDKDMLLDYLKVSKRLESLCSYRLS